MGAVLNGQPGRQAVRCGCCRFPQGIVRSERPIKGTHLLQAALQELMMPAFVLRHLQACSGVNNLLCWSHSADVTYGHSWTPPPAGLSCCQQTTLRQDGPNLHAKAMSGLSVLQTVTAL